MNKTNVLFLFVVFFVNSARAQVQFTEVNTPFNVDSLFTQLGVGDIPNGILIDRVDAHNIDTYNGSCNDCYTNANDISQFLTDFT